MRRVISGSIFLLLALTFVKAQSSDDLRIVLTGFTLTMGGGERPGRFSLLTRPVEPGEVKSSVVVMGCGAFSAHPASYAFNSNATAGWQAQITPMGFVGKSATFRLKWTRVAGVKSQGKPIEEEIELTLKPGESRVLDLVAVPPTVKAIGGGPCDAKAVGLRVSVDYPASDRRLIAADVWLVQKFPNGREQSQLQSVRGVPHRLIPFYFDSVQDGTNRFDFFGTLEAEFTSGGIAVTVMGNRAGGDQSQLDYQSMLRFRSDVMIKPDETIEVALGSIEDKSSSLVGHSFSLRIRAKQLR